MIIPHFTIMFKSLLILSLFLAAGTKFSGAVKLIKCSMDDEDYCVFKNIVVNKNEFVKVVADQLDKSQVLKVDFQTSTVQTVPQKIFEDFRNLEIILLSKRNVEEMKSGTLTNAKKLKILDLDRNKLTAIENGAFNGATNLENLFLCCNQLTMFPKKLLSDQTKLQYITLRANNIEVIHKSAFKKQINLQKIDLGGNQLQFLHKDLFITTPKLHVVYLNKNRLKAISAKMFSHLRSLQDLWLSQNACIDNHYEIAAFNQINSIERDLKNCDENYDGVLR